MFGVARPSWLWVGWGGNLKRYFNAVLRRRCEAMIDRITLDTNEGYEFQTNGSQYVVVVNVGFVRVQVYKDDTVLANLDRLESYSCPSNTGAYRVFNSSSQSADVLLVRYILL